MDTGQNNLTEAIKIVNDLIASGKLPPPDSYYKVTSVTYEHVTVNDGYYNVDGYTNVSSNTVNEGDITIYATGAETLEDAIVTYAHELGHFSTDWGGSESDAEAYGQEALRLYKEGN